MSYENPTQENMNRMKARLKDLEDNKEYAVKMKFGKSILNMYDSDITYQKRAIERAKSINPSLM